MVALRLGSSLWFFGILASSSIIVAVQNGIVHALSSPDSKPNQDNILKVLILRHGESNANAANVIQGSGYVSRLTDLGQEQARRAGMGAFDQHNNNNNDDDDDDDNTIDAVYCSPLARAVKTWQIVKETQSSLFANQEATILNDLREIDLYDWEGLDKGNLAKLFPDAFQAWKESRPHDLVVCESSSRSSHGRPVKHYPLLELWERADRVWDDILLEREAIWSKDSNNMNSNNNRTKCILIVAHGNLGQALLGTAMGWDATYFRLYAFPNCGVAELEWNLSDRLECSHQHQKQPSNQRPLAHRWRWRWPRSKNHKWKTLDKAHMDKAEGVREGALPIA